MRKREEEIMVEQKKQFDVPKLSFIKEMSQWCVNLLSAKDLAKLRPAVIGLMSI